MIRRFIIIGILINVCLLGGCGFKDIDKRFFVTQMGVDLSGNKDKPYKVLLKLAIPKPQIEPGKEQFQIVEENGATITEAVRLMKSKVDKELEFGHAKVIVFGEELARKNIKNTMDWFQRRRDIQKIAYVAVGSPNAESVIRTKPESERLPGNALFLSFDREGTESAYIITEYLFDFSRRLWAKGLDPVMPVITATGKSNYDIRRVALFDKTKIKEILSPDKTRLLNEIAFKSNKFDAVPNTKKIKMSVTFEKLSVNHWIHTPSSGNPFVEVNVKASGIVEEASRPLLEKNWKAYESDTAQTFEQRYKALLQKLQKMNIDPVGFGEDYLSSHLHGGTDWKKWQELYPHIDFKVHADVSIQSPGNIH